VCHSVPLVPRVLSRIYSLPSDQYVYGSMGFFNLNICRNTQDIRQITEYAHDNRVATDYHINETPMLNRTNISSNSATTQRTFARKIVPKSIPWWIGSLKRTKPASRWSIPCSASRRSRRSYAWRASLTATMTRAFLSSSGRTW
jgi:hypothetical protein